MSWSERIFFARSKPRRAFWTSASARARSARAACRAASDCSLPASSRVASIRASICPRRTVSPSLTYRSVMRPETSAATFTNFLGLISPDADTVDTRSRRATFWVWTGILLRRSLVTLKATTPPMTSTAVTPSTIRVLFDTAIYAPPGPASMPARPPAPATAQNTKYVSRSGKFQGNLAPSAAYGPERPGHVSARNQHVRIRTPYRTNGFRRRSGARSESPDRGRQSARAADDREDAGCGRLLGPHRARRAGGDREGDGGGRGPRHPRRDDAEHQPLPGLPPAPHRAEHQVRPGRDPHQQGPGRRPFLGSGDGGRLLHHQGLGPAADPGAREEHPLLRHRAPVGGSRGPEDHRRR